MRLGAADEAKIDVTRRRGDEVRGAGLARDVLAAVVDDATGQPFVAEEDRRAGRQRSGDRLALVERHLPARRQVVDGEAGAVQVGHFLHRLAEHQRVAAVVCGQIAPSGSSTRSCGCGGL